MAADAPPSEPRIYQLHVTLRDISPLIWRRLLVTNDTTIAQLHAILQTAMGWEDVHLHRFRIHGKEYGVYRGGGMIFDDDPNEVTLADFRLRAGERFVYEYDMGDFWEHDIRLERVVSLEPRKHYPVCVAGAGDCPPEDCGGPPGYRELLAELYSWRADMELREDMLVVVERLRTFYEGGPAPSRDDEALMDALDRMHQRDMQLPEPFDRRAVNAALRALRKEWTCTSNSNSS